MIKTLRVLCLFAAFVVALGFVAPIHRAGDAFALLRPIAGAACVLGLLLARSRWPRAIHLAAVIATAATVLPPVLSGPQGGPFRVYSKNLWFQNTQTQALAADIRDAAPDAVFLQELTDANRDLLSLLRADYPHQHVCDNAGWGDIAILSRIAFDGGPECSDRRVLALAPISVGDNRVWLGSIHVPWPWPQDTAAFEAEAFAMLQSLDAPLVLGGDFNIFPWAHRVTRIEAATQTRRAGPMRKTFTLKGLPFPIDHILAPGGGTTATRALLGSDHHGLVADVWLK